MGLYADWLALCEQPRPDAAQQEYWDRYFAAETENYRKILTSGQLVYDGTLEELAASFSMEPVVFCGFLDGINTSLTEPLELESLEPETVLHLEIDLEKLYYNMVAAKADWLYNLPMWDQILTEERRKELYKQQKASGTIRKPRKIGRNDPCPCGSGKKYKKCCGKNA